MILNQFQKKCVPTTEEILSKVAPRHMLVPMEAEGTKDQEVQRFI